MARTDGFSQISSPGSMAVRQTQQLHRFVFFKHAQPHAPPHPPKHVNSLLLTGSSSYKEAAALFAFPAVLFLNLSVTESKDRLWQEEPWALGTVPLACPPTVLLSKAVALLRVLSLCLPFFFPSFLLVFLPSFSSSSDKNK